MRKQLLGYVHKCTIFGVHNVNICCEHPQLVAILAMSTMSLLCSTLSKRNSETHENYSCARQQLSCLIYLCSARMPSFVQLPCHSYKKRMQIYKKHRDILELNQSSCSQPHGSNPSLNFNNDVVVKPWHLQKQKQKQGRVY